MNLIRAKIEMKTLGLLLNFHKKNYKTFNEGEEPKIPTDLIKLPNNFIESITCSITKEVMIDPWIDYEGNSYEKKAIVEHLNKNNISPITRNPLSLVPQQLYPNRALRDIIQSIKII